MKRLTTCLVFFLLACNSVVPKGVLPPEKMSATMKDMVLADEYMNTVLMQDSTKTPREQRSLLYARIFALHQTSRKEFYDSYTYYQQHPNLLQPLMDSVQSLLKKSDSLRFKKVIPDSVMQ